MMVSSLVHERAKNLAIKQHLTDVQTDLLKTGTNSEEASVTITHPPAISADRLITTVNYRPGFPGQRGLSNSS